MTDQGAGVAVKEEWRLAESALAAAEALVQLGLAPDAASRAYYAVFHAARALLFSIGVEPRSHAGVRTLFSRHFVTTGALSPAHAKALVELAALRAAGDYDSAFALGIEEVRPEVAKARLFVEEALRLLQAKSLL